MIELCFTNDFFGQRLNGSNVGGSNHIAIGIMELLVVAGMKGSLQDHFLLLQVHSSCCRIKTIVVDVCYISMGSFSIAML